jgi:hypothetical protein
MFWAGFQEGTTTNNGLKFEQEGCDVCVAIWQRLAPERHHDWKSGVA